MYTYEIKSNQIKSEKYWSPDLTSRKQMLSFSQQAAMLGCL